MQETPIVIHQHLMQKFMRLEKDFSNALALYSFYIYHAQKQKTNQPLATDSFTSNGLHWGIEKVKRIKKILKELKVIEVVQKKKYSYIHLFFIYTQKKIDEVLGKESTPKTKEKLDENIKSTPIVEPEMVKKPVPKTAFQIELEKNYIAKDKIEIIRETILSIKDIRTYRFDAVVFAKWIVYCENNNISYNTTHIKNWLKKLNKRTTIEQKKAIHNAINKKWRDFYLPEIKNSKYHHLLGKNLFLEEKNYEELLGIDMKKEVYFYTFKNKTLKTKERPTKLFNRYGYREEEVKTAPISLKVMKTIGGIVRRF